MLAVVDMLLIVLNVGLKRLALFAILLFLSTLTSHVVHALSMELTVHHAIQLHASNA